VCLTSLSGLRPMYFNAFGATVCQYLASSSFEGTTAFGRSCKTFSLGTLCRQDSSVSRCVRLPRASSKSSRIPLNTGARSNLSAVIALYSTSAGKIGSTQVALGFLTGTDRGDVLRMYGSKRSRSSYSMSCLQPLCAFPA